MPSTICLNRMALFLVGLAGVGVALAADTPDPIDIEQLLRIPRVADVQLSPDGRSVAYTVATPNVGANEMQSNLWIADTSKPGPTQITHTGKDRAPRWAPDGRRIAFLSRRDGKSQVYVLTLGAGEARPITHMPADVETLRWAPDGRMLIVSAVVDPECRDDDCLKASTERRAAGKAVRIYERWPVRSAMAWMDGMRSLSKAARRCRSRAARATIARPPTLPTASASRIGLSSMTRTSAVSRGN